MPTLNELRALVADASQSLAVAKLAEQQAQAQVESTQQAAADAAAAQQIVQAAAQAIQQHAHQRIASVVGRCLEAIFDEPYQFEVRFEQKRGRTEAQLVFVRDGQDVDPLTASGGGCVDVASFALRLAVLQLMRPRPRQLLILDEPFRFLSKAYRPRIAALLQTLSRELEMQFIVVTHSYELVAGATIIELS